MQLQLAILANDKLSSGEEHNFIIHHNGYNDSKRANFFPNQDCINHNLKTKLN
jgi:hypothetical protein